MFRTVCRTLLASLLLGSAWTAVPVSVADPPDVDPLTASGGAIHVAHGGRDGAPGTARSPVRTIGRAVSLAGPGDRIVVHQGVYHEGFVVPDGKPLTIVGRGEVWLDGSRVVRRWRSDARGYVSDRWTVRFDSSPTYTWGEPDNTEQYWQFVNPDRPMAAHPDQVWVDGRAQRQVQSLSQLRPGTFYVDEDADRLHLGSDPTGKEVRASDIAKAISIRAAGTRIRGIGVRRFAPSVPHMGAVTAERDRIVLQDMVIRNNATTGLHLMGEDTMVKRVRVVGNGMLGMSATHADRLRVIKSAARHNNVEGFNYAPVAGGAKIGRTDQVTVVSSTFVDNAGTGLWFDEGTYHVTVVDTLVRDNDHHGISVEISDRALVTDTVIVDNAHNGIKVNDTSDVHLWNNTLVGNGRSLNIVQDERNPRIRLVEVHNNIVAGPNPAGNCLLCVEDYSGRATAEEMGVDASGNVYQRRAADLPRWAVVWSRASQNPSVFDTVAEFRAATGQEAEHLELLGTPAVDASYRATKVVRRNVGIAEPTPATLARIVHVRPEGHHLGAWID